MTWEIIDPGAFALLYGLEPEEDKMGFEELKGAKGKPLAEVDIDMTRIPEDPELKKEWLRRKRAGEMRIALDDYRDREERSRKTRSF